MRCLDVHLATGIAALTLVQISLWLGLYQWVIPGSGSDRTSIAIPKRLFMFGPANTDAIQTTGQLGECEDC